MAARTRYDYRIHGDLPLVAATEFTYDGVNYQAGDTFPTDGLHRTKVAALYGARRVNFADEAQNRPRRRASAAAPDATETLVKIEAQPGGYYLISAPWLDEPERIRGKAKAEARAVEINESGEPDSHHGYTLTAGENGWYAITRADDEAETPVALNVHGEEAAREAVATLRRGELIEGTPLPEEWTPAEPAKVGDSVIVPEGHGDLSGQTGVVDSIDGEDAVVLVDLDEDHQETATVLLADLKPALGDPEAELLKAGDVVTVGEAESDLFERQATIESIDGELAAIKGFVGEGDDAQPVETTVPLASLTLAPPADGGNDTPESGAESNGEHDPEDKKETDDGEGKE